MHAVRWLLAAAFVCGTAYSTRADAISDFYKDKQVKLVISSAVGGGYDAYYRMIARYLGAHIPGKPTIVPQNMPGAGGVKAGNFLYAAASKDGLTIGGIQNTVPFEPMLGNDKALFDATKFNWLGSPSQEVAMLLVWHTVPVNTIADAKKHRLILAATGANSTPAFYARVLEAVFGIEIKLVVGYPGQTDALLGMERGENEGFPSAFWSSIKAVKPDWVRDKKIKFIVQYGLAPTPELKGVPFALDLIKKPDDKTLMEVASAQLALGRPMLAPPDVPKARVKALSDALWATFKDPAYRADCAKQRLECDDPVTAEQMRDILQRSYNAPKQVLARLRKINVAGRTK
jgi:tripartite-type tricarboxylate transporter receptor subunit TctC